MSEDGQELHTCTMHAIQSTDGKLLSKSFMEEAL